MIYRFFNHKLFKFVVKSGHKRVSFDLQTPNIEIFLLLLKFYLRNQRGAAMSSTWDPFKMKINVLHTF